MTRSSAVTAIAGVSQQRLQAGDPKDAPNKKTDIPSRSGSWQGLARLTHTLSMLSRSVHLLLLQSWRQGHTPYSVIQKNLVIAIPRSPRSSDARLIAMDYCKIQIFARK
jgi:hypothetical protein